MIGAAGLKGKEKRDLLKKLGKEGRLNKRFYHLEGLERLRVLLEVLPYLKGEVYLLYDLSRQLPYEAFFLIKDKLEELAGLGAAVIFLTTEHTVTASPLHKNYYFMELPDWSKQVEQLRETLKRQGYERAVEGEEEEEEEEEN